MRGLIAGLALAGLVGCGGGGGDAPVKAAVAQTVPLPGLTALNVNVQWPTKGSFVFSGGCRTPNSGGVSCYHFPNGGKIYAVSWESSIKVAHGEVLLMLVVGGRDPSTNVQAMSQSILNMHHNESAAASSQFKSVSLGPQFVTIPAGAYVWVYGEGNVSGHDAGVEVQTTIYVEGGFKPS